MRKGNRSKPKTNENCELEVATPSDSESVGGEVVDHDDSDVDQSSSDVELADDLTPAAKTSLQEEANSLYHVLTHTPKNPFVNLAQGRR